MIFKKENLLPIIILVVSSFIFLSYTAIKNPYSREIQIFIMFCLILLNLGIFHFHNLGDKRISFILFFLNCFILFFYVRVALPERPVLSLYYYFIIFLGFHAFEGTFSKRFYLRTRIIIMGYCKDFAFIKLFLWVCLVLLPSLIMYGPVIFTVYYPVVLFCYLFEYDIILFFLILIFLWCCLITLMNRYRFGLNYLKFILNYFSRRACLHYVGNAFGSRSIVKIFELLTPAKVVGSAVMLAASVVGVVFL
nr:hypothetical protein [Nitzschia traheaformis]